MIIRSCACQSFCVNTPADPDRKLDEFADTQNLARESNVRSNEAPTSLETSTLTLVLLPTGDFFTRFMKIFIETTQVQALAELQECPFKAKTLETYFGKSHKDCYHFCKQCEDYF